MLNKTLQKYIDLVNQEKEELHTYYEIAKDDMSPRDWQVLKEIFESKQVCEDLVREELRDNGYVGSMEG